MARPKISELEDCVKTIARIEKKLYKQIEQKANEDRRSINQEINYLLEKALSE